MFNHRKVQCNPYNTSSRVNPNTPPQQQSTYYTPNQIKTAYGLDLISPPAGKPLGFGIKIAIITCYHYSNLQSDLNKYCKQFNLTPLTLNIINQAGNISNSNWALESCLDTQMINTVAPRATVYVIESRSNTFADIKTAIITAVNLGVNIISMSFGSNEFSTQTSLENMFMNSGITFVAASGDNNSVSYPASSSNVIAIGGTTLQLNSNNTRNSETTWGLAGCGTSLYIAKPNYQSAVNNGSKINIPHLSLIGNPSYGFVVLCSLLGGYLIIGGTSAGCPLFAGIVAIANQIRRNSNKGFLTSISTSPLCIQRYLYQTIYTNNNLYSNCLYDITSGNDGNYTAGARYDIASGLGSIKANTLCTQFFII